MKKESDKKRLYDKKKTKPLLYGDKTEKERKDENEKYKKNILNEN